MQGNLVETFLVNNLTNVIINKSEYIKNDISQLDISIKGVSLIKGA